MVPDTVLKAFDLQGECRLLPGGQGGSYRCGDGVLKRVGDTRQHAWLATLVSGLVPLGFRVPQPIQANDFSWVVEGWAAWTWIPGEADPLRVTEILEIGSAFHLALAGKPDPGHFRERLDPWAMADRVAWQEIPPMGPAAIRNMVDTLTGKLTPIGLKSQLVHCDLLGNVRFSADVEPGIIDFSMYWRPADYALAVAKVDALDWHAVDLALFDTWAQDPNFLQLAARAEIFRLSVYAGFGLNGTELEKKLQPHSHTVRKLLEAFS